MGGEDKWSRHGQFLLFHEPAKQVKTEQTADTSCVKETLREWMSWPDMWFSELAFTRTMGRSTDCCCSVAKSCLALGDHIRTAARQAPLSFTVSWSLLRFTSIESWCYLSILSSTTPFFCFNLSQHWQTSVKIGARSHHPTWNAMRHILELCKYR